jgi:hypothetical protein
MGTIINVDLTKDELGRYSRTNFAEKKGYVWSESVFYSKIKFL